MIDIELVLDLLERHKNYVQWEQEWSGNPCAPTPPPKPSLSELTWGVVEDLVDYYLIHEDRLEDE